MTKYSLSVRLLACLLCLPAGLPVFAKAGSAAVAKTQSVYGRPFTNRFSDRSVTGPHLFFPHYQTANGDYGKSENTPPYNTDNSTSPSVSQSRQDVNEAALQGADGFSLDVQGANNAYASAVENMFTAADQYNAAHAGRSNGVGVTRFTPFLTFDFATFPENPSVIEAWILRSVKHPSYYKYRGRYFVSCYAGEGGGWKVVEGVWQPVIRALKAQNVSIYFVAGFNCTNAAGAYVPSTLSNLTRQAQGLLTQIPAQGEWQYGNGLGIPYSRKHDSETGAKNMAAADKAAGLSFMASVSYNYQGLNKKGRWYDEHYGAIGLDREWRDIISTENAFWVQFVTWNDFDEYSRLTNADEGPSSPWPYLAHSKQPGYYLSTLGVQALDRYYVQWYKTGARPRFANDNLFALYRTQPHSLEVPGDAANRPGYVTLKNSEGTSLALAPDTFFVTTGLPKMALLTVTNGAHTFKQVVPAGLHFLQIGPFAPGSVTMTLSRNGAALTTLTGHPIAESAAFYNWSQWSGYAHD